MITRKSFIKKFAWLPLVVTAIFSFVGRIKSRPLSPQVLKNLWDDRKEQFLLLVKKNINDHVLDDGTVWFGQDNKLVESKYREVSLSKMEFLQFPEISNALQKLGLQNNGFLVAMVVMSFEEKRLNNAEQLQALLKVKEQVADNTILDYASDLWDGKPVPRIGFV